MQGGQGCIRGQSGLGGRTEARAVRIPMYREQQRRYYPNESRMVSSVRGRAPVPVGTIHTRRSVGTTKSSRQRKSAPPLYTRQTSSSKAEKKISQLKAQTLCHATPRFFWAQTAHLPCQRRSNLLACLEANKAVHAWRPLPQRNKPPTFILTSKSFAC